MKTLIAFALAFAFLQDAPKEDPRFARLKKLVGDWANEKEPDRVASSWRLTAGGSTLQETLGPGTDHEMVTMYVMDGAELKLTHYCVMGNQPSMKAAKELKDGALTFECVAVGNAKSHDDAHMHSAKFTFSSDDKYVADWGNSKGGKDGDHYVFTMIRKK